MFGDGGENGGVIVGSDIFDISLEAMLSLFRVSPGPTAEGDSVQYSPPEPRLSLHRILSKSTVPTSDEPSRRTIS